MPLLLKNNEGHELDTVPAPVGNTVVVPQWRPPKSWRGSGASMPTGRARGEPEHDHRRDTTQDYTDDLEDSNRQHARLARKERIERFPVRFTT